MIECGGCDGRFCPYDGRLFFEYQPPKRTLLDRLKGSVQAQITSSYLVYGAGGSKKSPLKGDFLFSCFNYGRNEQDIDGIIDKLVENKEEIENILKSLDNG